MTPLTLHARWVLPVTAPPIENGYITISDSIAFAAKERLESGELLDFGDAILLPAFVNAHTHLALSSLRGQTPFTGSFVAWIKSLRQAMAAVDDRQLQAEAVSGLNESLSSGVTVVGDIGYGSSSVEAWNSARIRVRGFLEVMGIGPKRGGSHERSLDAARRAMSMFARNPLNRSGLSPHAPYSTDGFVYRQCSRENTPLCTHIAETRDELQFLSAGTGPLRDLLEEWGLWDGSFIPPGCSPVRYLRELGVLRAGADPRFAPLLAHANYVDDDDLRILAESNAHVVFCPRTHAFFHHEPHRYREMLVRGINVCLGTDSLASNDTLSILDEIRFLRSTDPASSDSALLEMATVRGATALAHSDQTMDVHAMRRADVVAVPLENPAARDPLEDLLRGSARPSHLFVAGRCVLPAPG